MALTTILTGEDIWLSIGGVKYKVNSGGATADFKVRLADCRGTADLVGQDKPTGYERGAAYRGTVISTDRTLLSLVGTATNCGLIDNTTTVWGLQECIVTMDGNPNPLEGAVEFPMVCIWNAAPTQLSGIS